MPVTFEAKPQPFGHLAIEETHQRAAPFDDRDLRAECRKDAGVFAADHAAADDRERVGNAIEVENGVRVFDVGIVERHSRGRSGELPVAMSTTRAVRRRLLRARFITHDELIRPTTNSAAPRMTVT